MGHLVRYGADIIEAGPANTDSEVPIIQHCSEVIMDFFDNATGGQVNLCNRYCSRFGFVFHSISCQCR